VELFDGVAVAQVALVVHHDQRHLVDRARVVLERLLELLEAGEVLLHAAALAVDHEDDAVDLVEELFARRGVFGRAGDGDDLDRGAHAAHFAELDRQHRVTHGRIEARRQLAHLAPVVRAQLAVDALQARALPRAVDAPVDDAGIHFAGFRKNLRHQSFPFLVRMRRAWVEIVVGTSLLFIRFRRSRSWR
jgi:hypothetical protein